MSNEQELTDYLNDIIIAITDIEEFTLGMSYELFSGDKRTQLWIPDQARNDGGGAG